MLRESIKNLKKGFTLVELIVVITILAILATIGFVSYQGYTKSARESARINDVRVIEKSLGLHVTRNSTLPTPDDTLTLTASGETVGYQGSAGTGVLTAISQSQRIVDPLDGNLYAYSINASRTQFQMLAFMEDSFSTLQALIPGTYANTDYSTRHPRLFGKSVGTVTHIDNTPLYLTGGLTSLDVVNYAGSTHYTAHFTQNRSVTGTGLVLREIIPNANCRRIKETESSVSGIYTLNPKQEGTFDAYCEMSVDSGGWMLVARSSINTVGNLNFGWTGSTGNIQNDDAAYSLGNAVARADIKELLYTTYVEGKTINSAIKVGIDSNFYRENIIAPDGTTTDFIDSCEQVYNPAGYVNACLDENTNNRPSFYVWGKFGRAGSVFMDWRADKDGILTSDGYTNPSGGAYHLGEDINPGNSFYQKQGMVFVR